MKIERARKSSSDLTLKLLLKHRELARILNVSPRTLDNWRSRKVIPYIKVSARLVRYDLSAVMRALARYEIREIELYPNAKRSWR